MNENRRVEVKIDLVPDTSKMGPALGQLGATAKQVESDLSKARAHYAGLLYQPPVSGPLSIMYQQQPVYFPQAWAGEKEKEKDKDKDKGGVKNDLIKTAAYMAAASAVLRFTEALGAMGNSLVGTETKLKNLASTIPIIGSGIASMIGMHYSQKDRYRLYKESGEDGTDVLQSAYALFGFGKGARIADEKENAFMDRGRDVSFGLAFQQDQYRISAMTNTQLENKRRIAFTEQTSERVGNMMFSPDTSVVGPVDPRSGRTRFAEKDADDELIRSRMIALEQARGATLEAEANETQANKDKRLHYNTSSDMAALRSGRGGFPGAAESAVNRVAFETSIQLSEGDNRLAVAEALQNAEEQIAKSQMAAAEYQKLSRAEYEASVAAARAIRNEEEKRTDILRARLSILKQEQQTVGSGAEQFGQFDPLKQRAVRDVLQRAKRDGYESLDQAEKQLLSGTAITADFARKMGKKSVEDSDVFKDVVRDAGFQDQAELKKKVGELETKIVIDMKFNDVQLQEALQAAFKKLQDESPEAELLKIKKLEAALKALQARIARAGGG